MVLQSKNPAWALHHVVSYIAWVEVAHIKYTNPALFAHLAYVHTSNPRHTE